jgi:hypothetical protein
MAKALSSKNVTLVIASDDSQVMGWMLYRKVPRDIMFYDKFDFRNMGIATQLFDVLLDHLQSLVRPPRSINIYPHCEVSEAFFNKVIERYKNRIRFVSRYYY